MSIIIYYFQHYIHQLHVYMHIQDEPGLNTHCNQFCLNSFETCLSKLKHTKQKVNKSRMCASGHCMTTAVNYYIESW